jgi:hypothetical protein
VKGVTCYIEDAGSASRAAAVEIPRALSQYGRMNVDFENYFHC